MAFRGQILGATGWLLCLLGSSVFAQQPFDAERASIAESATTRERARSEAEGDESEEEIETDRDSFTPATTTAGWDRLIVESAYSYVDNRHTFETHSYPELIARYGLTERLELRLGWNYEVGGEGDITSGSDSDFEYEAPGLVRSHQVAYGLKARVSHQDAWLPASACIIQGFTPTGGPINDSQLVVTYVTGWKLPNSWQLDTALRYGTESDQHEHGNLWAPSAVLKVPVGERWKAHVEYFGIFADGLRVERNPQFISPGLHYLIGPNLEIGTRLGWGLNSDAPNFFCNNGLGIRF